MKNTRMVAITGTSTEAPPGPRRGAAGLGFFARAPEGAAPARAPSATVWAVDTNERARELTAANAERNGVGNVRVVDPDEVLHTSSSAAGAMEKPVAP